MTTILELKEKIIRFCGRNEAYLMPVVKFLMSLAVFLTINRSIGYMERLGRLPVAVILALLCAVLPVSVMLFLASVLILLHLYALSIEVCLVGFLLFVVVYLLYFRFAPRYGFDVALSALCLKWGIPYVMPIGMGLLQRVYSVFALICGTVVYFFLDGVSENAAALGETASDAEGNAVSKVVVVLNQLVGNREMYLVLGVTAFTLIAVYVIRRLSIEYAWSVAIVSGSVIQAVSLIAGYALLDISGKTVQVLVGSVVSMLIAFVLQFFFFHLDYSRTERLQFEDDEYYYYVKAVPKVLVPRRQKKVKRFAGGDGGRDAPPKKKRDGDVYIDEDLF